MLESGLTPNKTETEQSLSVIKKKTKIISPKKTSPELEPANAIIKHQHLSPSQDIKVLNIKIKNVKNQVGVLGNKNSLNYLSNETTQGNDDKSTTNTKKTKKDLSKFNNRNKST